MYLFLVVPWVGLWSVILAFPGHIHFLLHDCEAHYDVAKYSFSRFSLHLISGCTLTDLQIRVLTQNICFISL